MGVEAACGVVALIAPVCEAGCLHWHPNYDSNQYLGVDTWTWHHPAFSDTQLRPAACLSGQ
jgi:hypothetical protein